MYRLTLEKLFKLNFITAAEVSISILFFFNSSHLVILRNVVYNFF